LYFSNQHENLRGNMKPLTFSGKEWMIMLILIPPITLLINYFVFGKLYFTNLHYFLYGTGPTFVVLILVYILCGMVASLMLNRLPKYSQTFQRIGLSLLAYVLIMIAGITIIFLGYDYVGFLGYEINWNNYAWAIVIGILCNLLATSFNEGAAFFEKWRTLAVEAENLKKENLQSQLEALKNQVNPHFLFNSLNSLSALIAEEPGKAETFLDDMSKVYRYMLRNNEEGLTSLDSEILFIQSYFHMLKTRYGEGLEMEIKIDEQFLKHQLPPLTLQMLVENAVKHNMILKESPLHILIMTTNTGKLVVNNNIQLKTSNVQSNKVGLFNIVNKYRLLNQEDIMVNDAGTEFSVVLPLIE
jgi:sensor histidine kinase YesM